MLGVDCWRLRHGTWLKATANSLYTNYHYYYYYYYYYCYCFQWMPHTVIEEDKNQGKDVRKKRCNLGLTIKPLSPDVSK